LTIVINVDTSNISFNTKRRYYMIATTILARVDNERLQRGVEGLASGAYSITISRCNEDEVSAFVSNGDGKDYSVTLTAVRSFCGCRDAMFRGKTCKHAVALALYAIRTPQPKTAAPAPQFPTFHLMWRDGLVVWGDPHAERVQMWPWTQGMLGWPEVCSSCVTAYNQPNSAPF
jgi:hypothetical protein